MLAIIITYGMMGMFLDWAHYATYSWLALNLVTLPCAVVVDYMNGVLPTNSLGPR